MRRLRAVASLLAIGVICLGPPLLLRQWGGDLSSLSDLQSGWASDRSVYALLTATLWSVWAVAVAALATEVGSTLSGRPTARVPIARPFQRLAAGLVGALLLTGAASQGSAAPPARPTPIELSEMRPSVASSPIAPPSVGTPILVPTTPEPTTIVVQRGDSAWGIAERLLGDGQRWRELWALNQGTVQPDGSRWTDPQVIDAGWRLLVPTIIATATSGGVHVVVAGESLSTIARDHLGDPSLAPRLFDQNRGAPQPDGGALTDPDLIRPGWTLRLPPSTDAARPPPPPASPPAPARPAPTPPAAPDPIEPPTTPSAPRSDTSLPDNDPHVDADRPTSSTGSSEVGWWAASASALVLATAVVVRMRRRWRTRVSRRPRSAVIPSIDAPAFEVVPAADVPLVRWAGQALGQLVSDLPNSQVSSGPVLVEISAESGVEVLWEQVELDPPGGWEMVDGGWSWRLPYDPEAPVPADSLPPGMPGLVSIGERNGRQLMVDLEAFGTVSVDGPASVVQAWLRSIAAELATGDDLSSAIVIAVDDGFDLDGLKVDRATMAEAALRLRRRTEQPPSPFPTRCGSPVPSDVDAVVVVTASDDDLPDVPPRCGAAIVGAGLAPARLQVHLDEDGIARLEPLGVTFTAASLPAEAARQLADLLEDDGQVDLDEADAVAILREASTEPEPPLPFPDEEESEPQLLVRVLGSPAVVDRPALGRRETIIATFLAVRGVPTPASTVQDAVWGGSPIEPKTLWNVIGATRRALGDLPDGTPVMPAADRSHGTLSVSTDVATDLDLLRRQVAEVADASTARARELLRAALDLVHGPPFDAAGYDWAFRDQHVSEACALIESAAQQLVDLSLEDGDLEGARRAITQGLRGLPGNELLYRLRMKVESEAGNTTGVTAAYDELSTYLADLDTEPSEETTALRARLVA